LKRTGAQIFIDSLLEEGVEHIFGYPGGAVLPIYDVLYKCPIKHFIVRHEQAAAHAADGYARSTGKVGVCLATSGPGATNLVTGIATAYMDSIPIVCFTGQVPTSLIGNDAFQEADIVGMTRPATKHNYLVRDVNDLPRIIKEAFFIASTGRPGPVLIDLPKDVLVAETTAKAPKEVSLRGYNPTIKGNIKQIGKVAKAILKAKNPVLYTGGGIITSDASAELYQLATSANIPVTTTLMGLGGFPEDHELSLGMLGMHGTYYANMAMYETDMIIAVGARFDDRITGRIDDFAPNAKIVHIDIDPAAISKNVIVDIPLVGDAKSTLSKLNKIITKLFGDGETNDTSSWRSKIAAWKKDFPLKYEKNRKLKPQFVIEELSRLTEGKAIVTTEVGQNQMWAAQFYKYSRPRTFISSGGLGTMGYGFPAAMGAKVGNPDCVVIGIAGDGSFQMNSQELATVVQFNIQVKIAILNNSFLGMVRQWQELFFDKRYSSTCMRGAPDFVKLAEAYGATGLRATEPEQVAQVIEKALSIDGPVIMDFVVDPEENVAPMVPAGKSLREMILV